VIMQ